MDPTIADSVSGLGVGAAAIYVMYLVFKLFLAEISKRDRAFVEYVESHNHKSVEVMAECRDAIREAGRQMQLANNIQERMLDRLTDPREFKK